MVKQQLSRGSLLLSQSKYIRELLDRAGTYSAKCIATCTILGGYYLIKYNFIEIQDSK